MYGRSLVNDDDLNREEILRLFELAREMKSNPHHFGGALTRKTLAMIFQKPSLRTRVTFETAMTRMGGHAIYLAPSDISLGKRESVPDVARNLSRWVDGIIARVFAHDDVVTLAEEATVPVVNALSDELHPCQALADFFTLWEKKGEGPHHLVFIGDGNNVACSLLLTGATLGHRVTVVCPEGYDPPTAYLERARERASENGGEVRVAHRIEEVIADADAVYTDVWASMGQEKESEARRKVFSPYQVNERVMGMAKPDAIFMHCLPAHRGEEVTDEVIDSWQSVVYDEAENRMHVQAAILHGLMVEE